MGIFDFEAAGVDFSFLLAEESSSISDKLKYVAGFIRKIGSGCFRVKAK